MDIYSLVTAYRHAQTRPAPMSAEAEDRYYAQYFTLPRPSPRLLTSIWVTVGVVLLLGISLV